MKKSALIFIIALVLVLTAVVLIRSLSQAGRAPSISLPPPAQEAQPDALSPADNSLAVTPDTIGKVLKKLDRTESYSRTFTVTTYWEGGQSTERLSVWRQGDNMRVSADHDGTVKNTLILDGSLHVWYQDGTGEFSAVTSLESVSSADRYTRLITYEELLGVSSRDILDAGYEQLMGEPGIYAQYVSPDSGYVNHIHVSVSSGLLFSAQIYDGDMLIYSMESVTTELSTPADSIFQLPVQ